MNDENVYFEGEIYSLDMIVEINRGGETSPYLTIRCDKIVVNDDSMEFYHLDYPKDGDSIYIGKIEDFDWYTIENNNPITSYEKQ